MCSGDGDACVLAHDAAEHLGVTEYGDVLLLGALEFGVVVGDSG